MILFRLSKAPKQHDKKTVIKFVLFPRILSDGTCVWLEKVEFDYRVYRSFTRGNVDWTYKWYVYSRKRYNT